MNLQIPLSLLTTVQLFDLEEAIAQEIANRSEAGIPTPSDPIAELEISLRLYKHLAQSFGITHVRELETLTRTQVYETYGIGEKTIQEIEELMDTYNLKFKSEDE